MSIHSHLAYDLDKEVLPRMASIENAATELFEKSHEITREEASGIIQTRECLFHALGEMSMVVEISVERYLISCSEMQERPRMHVEWLERYVMGKASEASSKVGVSLRWMYIKAGINSAKFERQQKLINHVIFMTVKRGILEEGSYLVMQEIRACNGAQLLFKSL